jgi:hypothetical protein
MFVFLVNISIDLYVGYLGIESDVRGGGRRGHKSFFIHMVGLVHERIIYLSCLILEKTSFDPTEKQQSQS